jgi:hypothetical protein
MTITARHRIINIAETCGKSINNINAIANITAET